MIVDASAVLAVAKLEDDAWEMMDLMRSGDELLMSPVNWLETWIKADRNRNTDLVRALDAFYGQFPVRLAHIDPDQSQLAREAHRVYGGGSSHPAKLNMGDCFAYALAKQRDEPLLFKGDDFVHTDVRSAL